MIYSTSKQQKDYLNINNFPSTNEEVMQCYAANGILLRNEQETTLG